MNNFLSMVFGLISSAMAILMIIVIVFANIHDCDSSGIYIGAAILCILNAICAAANFKKIEFRE